MYKRNAKSLLEKIRIEMPPSLSSNARLSFAEGTWRIYVPTASTPLVYYDDEDYETRKWQWTGSNH